jgi:hypothetical protein
MPARASRMLALPICNVQTAGAERSTRRGARPCWSPKPACCRLVSLQFRAEPWETLRAFVGAGRRRARCPRSCWGAPCGALQHLPKAFGQAPPRTSDAHANTYVVPAIIRSGSHLASCILLRTPCGTDRMSRLQFRPARGSSGSNKNTNYAA